MALMECTKHVPMHTFGRGWVCAICREPLDPTVRTGRSPASDLAGMKIALEQAWESNREREAQIKRLELEVQYWRDEAEAHTSMVHMRFVTKPNGEIVCMGKISCDEWVRLRLAETK